jgi:hypothetical protein
MEKQKTETLKADSLKPDIRKAETLPGGNIQHSTFNIQPASGGAVVRGQ